MKGVVVYTKIEQGKEFIAILIEKISFRLFVSLLSIETLAATTTIFSRNLNK